MISIIVEVIDRIVRLRVVEPEHVDPEIRIILFADLPEILLRRRIRDVDLQAVTLKIISLVRSVLGADQQPQVGQLLEMNALLVHGRPEDRGTVLPSSFAGVSNFGNRPRVFTGEKP